MSNMINIKLRKELSEKQYVEKSIGAAIGLVYGLWNKLSDSEPVFADCTEGKLYKSLTEWLVASTDKAHEMTNLLEGRLEAVYAKHANLLTVSYAPERARLIFEKMVNLPIDAATVPARKPSVRSPDVGFVDLIQDALAKAFNIVTAFGGEDKVGVEVSELVGILASIYEEDDVIARVKSLNAEGCAEYRRRLKEAVQPLMKDPTGDIASRIETARKLADEIYEDLCTEESEDTSVQPVAVLSEDDSAPSTEESIPEAVQVLPEGVLDQDPEAELPIEARNPDVKVTINAEPDITGLLAEMDANASTEVEPVVSEPSETTPKESGEVVEVTPEMAASIQAALGSAPKTNASHGVGRKRPTNKPKVAQSSKKTGKIRPSFKK